MDSLTELQEQVILDGWLTHHKTQDLLEYLVLKRRDFRTQAENLSLKLDSDDRDIRIANIKAAIYQEIFDYARREK